MKRILVCLVALFLLMGISAVPSKVYGDYSGTISINSDGSVTPSDAPIWTVDNITYVLAENINGSINVMKDNIIIDGATHTIQSSLDPWAFQTKGIITSENGTNITIKNCNVQGFFYGIEISGSSNCTMVRNNLTSNLQGIRCCSNNTTVNDNNFDLNVIGVSVLNSNRTSILNNYFFENGGCIDLSYCNDSMIQANSMFHNSASISISGSHYSRIMKNDMLGNMDSGYFSIRLVLSSNNILTNNNISEHYKGLELDFASNNTISENNIENNTIGIDIRSPSYSSTDNYFYHNNLLENNQTVAVEDSHNVLDNGFEGNYWSDYNGTDNNQDGMGDTPYIIDENNTDHYPLMGHFESFNVLTWSQPNDGFGEVDVISNFTISDLGLYGWLTTPNQYLQAGQLFLRLVPVQEQNMTAGFCRMTLPNNMLNTSDYIVLINMTSISVNKLATSNNTHTTLYFTFNTSDNEEIIIVPELPSLLILPLFFMATLLTIIFCRKKLARTA